MPTNNSSRMVLIIGVLLMCLFGFPGVGGGILKLTKLFDDIPFSQKTNLKPGIDIAGGVSMVYEIKVPYGSSGKGSSGNPLSEDVASALKKRVDPNGLLNLIWRPQGDTKLEIQIPRPANAGTGKKEAAQKSLIKAQDELNKTNIVKSAVINAIEKFKGEERNAKLAELAGDSGRRKALFAALVENFELIAEAREDKAAAEKADDKLLIKKAEDSIARAEVEYEDNQQKIETDTLKYDTVKPFLEATTVNRNDKLNAWNTEFADFPARLNALKNLEAASTEMAKYKDQLDDATDLKRMLKGSGVLEFHILVTSEEMSSPEAMAMITRLETKGPNAQSGDTMQWYAADKGDEFKGMSFLAKDSDKRYVLAYTTADRCMVHRQNALAWSLETASIGRDQNGGNAVEFEFDTQGAKLFGELTAANLKKQLGIVLDGRMISAPTLQSQISKKGQITGDFSASQVKYLANTLSAGSLPAALAEEPISEHVVSPQLGVTNLRKGLIASGVGLVVVSIFLVSYYHLAGLVAFLAVILNLIIILGVLAMFGATFTMPSIAGIVLTVGTAIDANVLVFERMREEEHRGHPLKTALTHAYDRALSAIVDSNMTTAITSLFLYIFGSEEVKGFGLTLLIGIVSSLFTALFVTKTIFAILISKWGIKELSSIPTKYPKWDAFLKPNIDWMGMIWPFIIFSTVFTIVGLSAFFIKKRQMFDIEFASGTVVQIELVESMSVDKVREKISTERESVPSASVVSIGGTDDRQFEIVTPNDRAKEVREGILKAMGSSLKLELPSKFAMALKSVDEIVDGKLVRPIESASFDINGRQLEETPNYIGGAAILLKDLEPPISANEVRQRIERASTAPGGELNMGPFKYEVIPLDPVTGKDKNNLPVKNVVVLVVNSNFSYDKGDIGWRNSTVSPMWKLINEGVNREAKLQKVSSFNPQVAGDTQREALLATVLSVLVIMIYIWFRFGDMTYAIATVVALVHDTVIVVGAIGLSHYLDNGLGHALLIEPFRINLTLVAAILTIMGYSMIDTIVVFDRIRENRGRYGTITRKVINDSVNQTLSRTLLTAGNTMVMVTVMYICGGDGIHGFTFVMLVGIVVGTYSSVAIATPILLIGGDKFAAGSVGSTGGRIADAVVKSTEAVTVNRAVARPRPASNNNPTP